MNVAGKSLQDIYDSGARRLDELEQGEKANLADAADAHLDERARVEPDNLKQLEERAGELEDEVKGFLSRGLERIEKTVQAESAESERHIDRLVEGLVLLTKKFSESIGQLRQLAESQLTDLGADCHHIYELHAQSARGQLLHEGTVAVSECRHEAVEGQQKLAQLLERSWQGVYEKEIEVVESLNDGFSRDARQVEERFKKSTDTLSEKTIERLSQLTVRAKSSQNNVKALVERVVEQSDRHAFDTDVKLKEGFSSLLYELMGSFDDSASRGTGEIASLHESSMADLTMKSQELSREMDSLAENMCKSAGGKSQDFQDKGTSMLDGYTSALNEKLDASNVFHQDLASERARMVSEIWSELTDLRQTFDDKIQSLAQSTLDRMRGICDEAELAIVNSQQTCCNDSKTHAGNKQQIIDSAAKEFLGRIERTRKTALDGISRAAGGDTETVAEEFSQPEEEPKNDNKERSAVGEDDEQKTPSTSPASESQALDAADGDDEGDEEHHGESPDQANPRPANDTETGAESGGESRKRRKGKTDKRSPGDAKK